MSSEEDTITIGCVGITKGKIPKSVNDFEFVTRSSNGIVYEDDEGYQVRISHRVSGANRRRRKYTLSLKDQNGEEIQKRTIKHGPYTDRDLGDATDAVKTQLWEWARYSVGDRHPIQPQVEALGEVNPHPPGERPTVSEQWYFEYSPETTKVNDPDPDSYSTHVPYSRYEFKRSNEDNNWYCATITVRFNHEPPSSVEPEPEHVYGVYIYTSLNWLKPVDEREGEHDKREYERTCIRNDKPHESISHDELINIIKNTFDQAIKDAEAIGDEDRRKIRKNAERQLNPSTGEYENQARIGAF